MPFFDLRGNRELTLTWIWNDIFDTLNSKAGDRQLDHPEMLSVRENASRYDRNPA